MVTLHCFDKRLEFSSLLEFEDYVKTNVFPCEYSSNPKRIAYFADKSDYSIGVYNIHYPDEQRINYSSIGMSFPIKVDDSDAIGTGEFLISTLDRATDTRDSIL